MYKILIVEDEISLSKVLTDKLKNEGYRIINAENGQIGIEKAFYDKPDLILLDLLMPVKDGLSFLGDLRKDTWGKSVPVIMLSNSGDFNNVLKAMEKNVTEYLVKTDWSLEEIVQKIHGKLYTGSK